MSIVSFEVFRTPFGFFGRWNCPACEGEQTRVFTLYYEHGDWPGFMEGVPVGISHYCKKCGHYHHPEFFFKGKDGWTQIPLDGPIRGGEYPVEVGTLTLIFDEKTDSARILLDFLEWVEKSQVLQEVKTHTKTLVQLYLAKLYDENQRTKEGEG